MTTTSEDASPARPAQTRSRGLRSGLGVGALGLLLAQVDGVAHTVGVLLLVVALAGHIWADAVARVLAALPPVLRELRKPEVGDAPARGEALHEGPEREGR